MEKKIKSPAFLFYTKDFYEGTRTMDPLERACYIDLLVYQHEHEYIPLDIKKMLLYCTGISEATLIGTLNDKFIKTDIGYYNLKQREVSGNREKYLDSQSRSGLYGQFIKKLKKCKTEYSFTEMKEYIELEITKEKFIDIIIKDNNFDLTLKGILKGLLKQNVNVNENVISLSNSSNNTNELISEKIEPLKFLDCIEKMKTDEKLKEDQCFVNRIKPSDYIEYLEIFARTKNTDNPALRVEYSDKRQHFINWVGTYKNTFEKNRVNNQQTKANKVILNELPKR